MDDVVVVGVDQSETAAKAAAKAARLASALGGQLVVVHAFDSPGDPVPAEITDVVPLTASDAAAELAQHVIDDLRRDHPDLTMTPRAEYGKPAEALLAAAGRVGASVIVVGNKRVQGISRVLGSIARDVAQHAPCDVFIAHTVDR